MDKILIVEDEKNFDVLNKKLSSFYSVIFVGTTKEAVDVIGDVNSGIVCALINISLEGQNVMDIFEFMQNNNSFEEIPVAIAVEDFNNLDKIINEYDISEIIQKPYGTFTLAKRIDNIINLNKQKNELRLSNIELAQAYDSAKKAMELRSKFLLNTSHDIRTPMNAIIGMTEMAKKYIDNNEKVQTCIDNLMTASDHLLNILNDILDMSYIEKDQMSYNIIECNIGNIVKELSVIIKQQCDNKNLKYELKIHHLINESIWANPTRLTQMFINILSNSIKYTESGGVVGLEISEKHLKEKNYSTYIFRFYDNGKGMSKEFLENLFVPFAREENVEQPYVEGTGLGMAITKSIIDSMGGEIDVSSIEGLGTQITVVLRFKKAANIFCRDEKIQNSVIYVYDMNKEHGKSIVNMFSSIGVDAFFYDNLIAFFEDDRKYNVLVVCLSRMDEDNLEVLFRIKQQMPHVKIVHIESPMYKISKQIDIFDGVIRKPFFPLEMFEMISNVLEDKNKYDVNAVCFDNMRVLVVDDNLINRGVLVEYLEAAKVESVQAENGEEAIEMLENAPEGYFDMVLMDIQMPQIDGCETTERIRNLKKGYHRYVPVIAVSADAFAEDKERAAKVGMNDYLCKPFKRESLYKCIEKNTDKRRKEL